MKLENAFKIAEIISRQQSGKITEAERRILEEWITESSDNRSSYENIIAGRYVNRRLSLESSIDAEEGVQKLIRKLKLKKRMHNLWRMGYTAAVIVLGFILSVKFFYDPEEQRIIPLAVNRQITSPGGMRALLILNDGRTIDLERQDSVVLEGINLLKQRGELTYRQLDPAFVKEGMNTLVVPVKGEYHIELSDGTKVWLNSDSRLKYPKVFKGGQREVWLEGEAYFEVAKDSCYPFIVRSFCVTTRVLGTVFNVSAYPGESVAVTLLKGKVIVASGNSGTRELTPGERLRYHIADRKITVDSVNTEEVVAWKNGLFLFHNDGLSRIVPQLERWYGVKIDYREQDFSDLKFYIRTRRYEDIATILRILKLTGKMNFLMAENQIRLIRINP